MSNVVEIQSAQRRTEESARLVNARWGDFEPFVDETVIADFLGIKPRRVLEMARRRELPCHPIGGVRKTWRFRVSEIDAHFRSNSKKLTPATISLAVPVTQERWKRVG
jgi:hypothetical protein